MVAAPRDPLTWTLGEAARYFTEAGIPTGEDQLAAIIAKLPGLCSVGKKPSGPRGGQGKALYLVRELMEWHSANARWLIPASAGRPGGAARAGRPGEPPTIPAGDTPRPVVDQRGPAAI